MEKTMKIMTNVMAALHTGGIEYDTNFSGYPVKRNLETLVEKGESPVEYVGLDGGDDFKAKFVAFANKPHYYQVAGECWADDGNFVVIQFSRTYEMDEEDLIAYANWCGYEDPYEAEINYGSPSLSQIYFNVRIAKGNIHSFVRLYAHYCW